jgi:hypothetical protein
VTFAPDGTAVQLVVPPQASFGITPSSAFLTRADGSQVDLPLGPTIFFKDVKFHPGDTEIKLFWNIDGIHDSGRTRTLTVRTEVAPTPERIISVAGVIQTTNQDREGGFCILKLKDGPAALWEHKFLEFPKWPDNYSQPVNFAVDAGIPANPVLEVILTQDGAREKNILWRFKTDVTFRTNKGRSIRFSKANQELHCGDGRPATVVDSIPGVIQ